MTVTTADQAVARLDVKLAEMLGEDVDPRVRAIADASPDELVEVYRNADQARAKRKIDDLTSEGNGEQAEVGSKEIAVLPKRDRGSPVVVEGSRIYSPSTKRDPAATPPSVGDHRTYIVQHGDTLREIGARYGVSSQDIATASGIDNPDLIVPGQVLTVPEPSRSTKRK